MVSFVIVSHSRMLADGVIDLAKMSAPDAKLAPAGGLPDGNYGTDFETISNAIEAVYTEDGVLVLTDLGSAVMTAEMVIEALNLPNIELVDCPIAEGAVLGSVLSVAGADFDEIATELRNFKIGGTE